MWRLRFLFGALAVSAVLAAGCAAAPFQPGSQPVDGVVVWTVDDNGTAASGGGPARFAPRGTRGSAGSYPSPSIGYANWIIQPGAGWVGDAGPWIVRTRWEDPSGLGSSPKWESFTLDTASSSYVGDVAGTVFSGHPKEPFGYLYTEPACPGNDGSHIQLGPEPLAGAPGVTFSITMRYCTADATVL